MYRKVKGVWKTRVLKPHRFYIMNLEAVFKPFLYPLEFKTTQKALNVMKINSFEDHVVISGKDAIERNLKIKGKTFKGKITILTSVNGFTSSALLADTQRRMGSRKPYARKKLEKYEQYTLKFEGRTYFQYSAAIGTSKIIDRFQHIHKNHPELMARMPKKSEVLKGMVKGFKKPSKNWIYCSKGNSQVALNLIHKKYYGGYIETRRVHSSNVRNMFVTT